MLHDVIVHINLFPGQETHIIRLPTEIYTPPNTTWAVSLQSYSLNIPDFKPEIVKLLVDEISGEIEGFKTKNILGFVNIGQAVTRGESHHHKFIRIQNHQLSKVTVRIQKLDGEPIIVGINSYISLRFRQMNSYEHDIPIHVHMHGEENMTDFDVELPHPVHMDPSSVWKIALSSMIFPNPETDAEDPLFIQIAHRDAYVISALRVDYSIDEIKTNIRKFVKKMERDIKDSPSFVNKRKLRMAVTPTGHLLIRLGPAEKGFEGAPKPFTNDVNLTLSNRLAYILGYIDRGYEQAGRTLKISPGIFKFPNKIDVFRDKCELLYVKSNIVSPAIVNGKFAPLLRIIPICQTENKYNYFESKNLEFHDIITSTLTRINISLRNQNNLPIRFESSKFNHLIINLRLVKLQ